MAVTKKSRSDATSTPAGSAFDRGMYVHMSRPAPVSDMSRQVVYTSPPVLNDMVHSLLSMLTMLVFGVVLKP